MLSTTPEIKNAMVSRFPESDFEPYFEYLDKATGNDHKHHVAPKKVFPDLKRSPENIRPLSFQEHFYAHYLLARAVPDSAPIQLAFWLMSNVYGDKIRMDELPYFAEMYATARETVKNTVSKRMIALLADPEFLAKNNAARDKAVRATRGKPWSEARRAASTMYCGRTHCKRGHELKDINTQCTKCHNWKRDESRRMKYDHIQNEPERG